MNAPESHPHRRDVLRLAGTTAAAAAAWSCSAPERTPEEPRSTERMPVLFFGHGSPMNAIVENRWSEGFRKMGESLPKPRAVLAVSAHWCTTGTQLTASDPQPTIHDFANFPQPLHELQYPAPGNPELARRVVALLKGRAISAPATSTEWGLDHGTWSVLTHLIPDADVPVVQLSLDIRLSSEQNFELARALSELRDEGVLILGSGNVTHNLQEAMSERRGDATPDWALEFDRDVAQAILDRNTPHLVGTWPSGKHAHRAHPTPDHWYPLLYAYAATTADDPVTFPIAGFSGSLSMRAVRWG